MSRRARGLSRSGRPGRGAARHRLARPSLTVIGVAIGFGVVALASSRPAGPETRLPQRYRLADLIADEQRAVVALRAEVKGLRAQVERELDAQERRLGAPGDDAIASVSEIAGLTPVRGPGVRVTLVDSTLDASPTGNVNDLVIHSQDVQAVVNALWRSGADAISINGQRLIGTSAVLCVGNTLLLNGTVHSPPYVVTAVGASREVFAADGLVRRLRTAADAFELGFSVERADSLEVPAYTGSTSLRFARPVTA